MAIKAEISWKRRLDSGERVEVYAQRVGGLWHFHSRFRRFEQWAPLPQPPLEDWLELLDAVRRRIQRRLLRPEEEQRVRERIREQYPEAVVP